MSFSSILKNLMTNVRVFIWIFHLDAYTYLIKKHSLSCLECQDGAIKLNKRVLDEI